MEKCIRFLEISKMVLEGESEYMSTEEAPATKNQGRQYHVV